MMARNINPVASKNVIIVSANHLAQSKPRLCLTIIIVPSAAEHVQVNQPVTQFVGQVRFRVLVDEIRVDEPARRVHPMPERTNVRGLRVHVTHHDVAFRDDTGQPIVLTFDFLFLPQLSFGKVVECFAETVAFRAEMLDQGDDDAARTEQDNYDTKQFVHDRLTISVNGAIWMLEFALAVI